MIIRLCRYLLYLSIFTYNPIFSKTFELAICAIFRDDAPYMKEWVDFHLKQGVQHFYLYDNFSQDKPGEELKEYIEAGIVEIIPWPKVHRKLNEWRECQKSTYMNCIRKYGKLTKWCAFLDTDEFLFCPDGKKLPDFLIQFEDFQCLCVDWQLYGTSNVQQTQKGRMIRELLYKAPKDSKAWTKCIVRPRFTLNCVSPHYFDVRNPNKCVDENKKSLNVFQCADKTPSIKKIRINHYFCRDMNFLHNKKIPRCKQQGRDGNIIIRQERGCNEVYDDAILKVIE